MATRGSYVHNSMGEFSGASRKFSFYAIFSKNWWFQTKRFTGLLELIQLYKQYPLEKFFICIIYQNYTLDLMPWGSGDNSKMGKVQCLWPIYPYIPKQIPYHFPLPTPPYPIKANVLGIRRYFSDGYGTILMTSYPDNSPPGQFPTVQLLVLMNDFILW